MHHSDTFGSDCHKVLPVQAVLLSTSYSGLSTSKHCKWLGHVQVNKTEHTQAKGHPRAMELTTAPEVYSTVALY